MFCKRNMIADLINPFGSLIRIFDIFHCQIRSSSCDKLLIDRHPFCYSSSKTSKTYSCIFQIGINHLSALPAAKCIHKRLGAFKMIQCHKRFNSLFQKIINQLIIESQSFFIGNKSFIRHNPAPGKSHAVCL